MDVQSIINKILIYDYEFAVSCIVSNSRPCDHVMYVDTVWELMYNKHKHPRGFYQQDHSNMTSPSTLNCSPVYAINLFLLLPNTNAIGFG